MSEGAPTDSDGDADDDDECLRFNFSDSVDDDFDGEWCVCVVVDDGVVTSVLVLAFIVIQNVACCD